MKKTLIALVAIIAVVTMFVVLRHKPNITIPKDTSPTHSTQSVPSGPAADRLKAAGIVSTTTKKILIDDIKAKPGQCQYKVVDAAMGRVKPDPKCNPGAVDTAVTQENIHQTICVKGYTDTYRPSNNVTDRAKTQAMSAYGIVEDREAGKVTYPSDRGTQTITVSTSKNARRVGTVEYDHIISLQLGGASTTSNLFPEPPKTGATGTTNTKDDVENKLKKAVCDGQVPLVDAQIAIAQDWTTALDTLGIKVKEKK